MFKLNFCYIYSLDCIYQRHKPVLETFSLEFLPILQIALDFWYAENFLKYWNSAMLKLCFRHKCRAHYIYRISKQRFAVCSSIVFAPSAVFVCSIGFLMAQVTKIRNCYQFSALIKLSFRHSYSLENIQWGTKQLFLTCSWKSIRAIGDFCFLRWNCDVPKMFKVLLFSDVQIEFPP